MTGTNNILKDFNELTSAERTELLVGAMLDMEISDELLARLQRWFLEEGDEQAKREAFLKYSQATVVPNADGPSRATRRRYMELAGKLGFEPERKRARKVWSRTGIWGSIAASLLLAVAAGYLWLSRTADPGVLVATSTVSERVILPDSSLVVVEPNSSLSYHRSFEEGREVDLDGEAFFRVKGDPDEIFTVNASDIRVRVYGTDFKVISRAGAADYCVSLFKGRVSVEVDDAVHDLEYGERLVVDRSDLRVRRGLIPLDDMLDGGYKPRLEFQDAAMIDVFRAMAAWYEVEFDIGADIDFSDASIRTDLIGLDLEPALNVLADINGSFSFEIEETNVIITNKNK